MDDQGCAMLHKSRHHKLVRVAAGVLQRADGQFLLGNRPQGKPYAGYWEFPGGKIEQGESPLQALVREFHEELGIKVTMAWPWLTLIFHYQHASVQLLFHRITAWEGEPFGHEGQQLAWQTPGEINVSPLLPANYGVLKALELPSIYGISAAESLGSEAFLNALEHALTQGLRLLQVRENHLSQKELALFSREVLARAHAHGAKVLLNGEPEMARAWGFDGVHLNSTRLAACKQKPTLPLVAASCHNSNELRQAQQLGMDFVVLGSVLPTVSHPGVNGMGWAKFVDLVREYPIPVYALGGMTPTLRETAWRAGAHGIALRSQLWC